VILNILSLLLGLSILGALLWFSSLDRKSLIIGFAVSWGISVLLLHAAFVLFRDERRRAVKLAKQLQSSLLIFFSQGGSCQETQGYVRLGEGRKGVRRLFRVGIRNGGGAIVQGVQVKLVDIAPKVYPISQQLPILLHRMHDNNQPWETEFDLRPGAEEYIDVVHKEEEETRYPHEFIVFWLNPLGLTNVDAGHYTLTLVAQARNSVSCPPQKFVIQVDEQGHLHFDPATSDL